MEWLGSPTVLGGARQQEVLRAHIDVTAGRVHVLPGDRPVGNEVPGPDSGARVCKHQDDLSRRCIRSARGCQHHPFLPLRRYADFRLPLGNMHDCRLLALALWGPVKHLWRAQHRWHLFWRRHSHAARSWQEGLLGKVAYSG